MLWSSSSASRIERVAKTWSSTMKNSEFQRPLYSLPLEQTCKTGDVTDVYWALGSDLKVHA